MGSKKVTIAVEGPTDVAVVGRVLALAEFEMGPVHGRQGKGWLDKNLNGYNRAAHRVRWVVLRDFDLDAACVPELLERLLPNPGPQMRFRIAVHEVEAWLLADRERAAKFLAVPLSKIPVDPETLAHPKMEMVSLARFSRNRLIR